MTVFEAILLGVIQGLTEFLPVSSSGHLVMAQAFLSVPSPGVFLEVVLHVGTLLSVIVVYRRRLLGLVGGVFRRDRDELRYAGLLLLASVPAGVVGVGFEDAIVAAFDAPWVTGVALITTGCLLWSTRWIGDAPRVEQPTWPIALLMGVGQAFAILPGISRSGTTITAGLWTRFDAVRAAEFSFLMSVIAIAGAALLQVPHLAQAAPQVGITALVAGFIASLVVGVLAIVGLVWLLRKQRFWAFAPYVWVVGILFLLYVRSR